MRKVRNGGRALGIDASVSRAVERDVKITRVCAAEAGDARRPVLIRLSYSARNPVAVSIELCAQNEAEVFDRHIPRAELRQALQRRVGFPDLVMYPDALRGRVVLRFTEHYVTCVVHVFATDIAVFLAETDEVVPVERELDAVNAALAYVLDDAHLSDTRH